MTISAKRAVGAAVTVVALATMTVAGGTAFGAAPAKDGPPTIQSQPTISGTAQVGQKLTVNPGTWDGSKPMQFSYQWQRCKQDGTNCLQISGATDQTYTLTQDDLGMRMRSYVWASNKDGKTLAISGMTDVVKPGPAQAPTNTAPPTISGSAEQDAVLTASPGSWQGTTPIGFSYRWRTCDSHGGGCKDTSVTAQTYRLGADDVGHTLRVVVAASNSTGSGTATSSPSAVVAKPSSSTSGLPEGAVKLPDGSVSIPASSVALPQRLIIDRIQYTPSRISDRSQPLVARFHVVDTRGFSVRDVLVYAAGVPFDRLSKEPEVQTGQDGWATVTFGIQPTFQLRHGNLVVIFVRARKSGDSVLAGVSTRRLVSVRVG